MAAKLSGPAVLAFFCAIQFWTYFDRGIMSGLLTFAEDEFSLSGVKSGGLGSSYFISVMVVAPIVAGALVGTSGRMQMLGICFGSVLWAAAVALCGLAPTYAILLTGRTFTGLGEAFYCVLASPIIDDNAPPGKKSLYLGSYYSLVYVATGIGFVAPSFSKDWDSGRLFFFIEAVLMLPVVAFGVIFAGRFHGPPEEQIPLTRVDGSSPTNSQASEPGCRNAVSQTWQVLTNLRYFMFFMGYGALVFSLNGWNFWGPAYMQEVLHLPKARGSIELGAVVVIAGLAGSSLGGLALDRMTGQGVGATRRCIASARICALSALLSLPFGVLATLARNEYIFMGVAALFIFFLTMSTAPCCVGMMEAVHPECRGIAMGLSSFGAHIFGDVASPLLVGLLKDNLGSLVPGMWLLVLWVGFAVFFWGIASVPMLSKPREQTEYPLGVCVES